MYESPGPSDPSRPHLLLATRDATSGWLSPIGLEPLTARVAEPELEAPHILELEGFETWRCHPPESTTDSTEPELVIEGPSRHHPSALLDALVQRRPRDRRGLSRPPPDADDQGLRWIRPHFRGPAPAALVERDYRLRQRGEAE